MQKEWFLGPSVGKIAIFLLRTTSINTHLVVLHLHLTLEEQFTIFGKYDPCLLYCRRQDEKNDTTPYLQFHLGNS